MLRDDDPYDVIEIHQYCRVALGMTFCEYVGLKLSLCEVERVLERDVSSILKGSSGDLEDFSLKVVIRDSSLCVSSQLDGVRAALGGVRDVCLDCSRLIHSIENFGNHFGGFPSGCSYVFKDLVCVTENDFVYQLADESLRTRTSVVRYVLDGGEVGFDDTSDM